METVGAKFDPMRHEVVEAVEKSDVEEGTIIEEVRAGYMIGERVLKTAIVKIARLPVENEKTKDEPAVNEENEKDEQKNETTD
jgi:molecular chaperone GrpE